MDRIGSLAATAEKLRPLVPLSTDIKTLFAAESPRVSTINSCVCFGKSNRNLSGMPLVAHAWEQKSHMSICDALLNIHATEQMARLEGLSWDKLVGVASTIDQYLLMDELRRANRDSLSDTLSDSVPEMKKRSMKQMFGDGTGNLASKRRAPRYGDSMPADVTDPGTVRRSKNKNPKRYIYDPKNDEPSHTSGIIDAIIEREEANVESDGLSSHPLENAREVSVRAPTDTEHRCKRYGEGEADSIPAQEGDSISALEGDLIPAQEGDLIPAQEGDLIPAQEGDLIPAQEGDLIPVGEAESIPAQEDERNVPGSPIASRCLPNTEITVPDAHASTGILKTMKKRKRKKKKCNASGSHIATNPNPDSNQKFEKNDDSARSYDGCYYLDN